MVVQPTLQQLTDSQRGVAARIADRLVAGGFQAWLVGGCVRDAALCRTPSDLDIATDARPEQIEGLFEHTIGVGRAFGTIVVAEFGEPIEVTTFRADGTYQDGRRPSSVDFSTSLEEDARRRDFTCNALYLNAQDGELRDPTGGMADLSGGHLRTVGSASARFEEDSLRLLRLVRFAATHGLVPVPEALTAARRAAPLLARVARERVLAELTGLFEKGEPGRGLELLLELGLADSTFGAGVTLDAWQVAVAKALPRAPGVAVGLALVLSGNGVGAEQRESARAALVALKPSRELARAVLGLLEGVALLAEGASDATLIRLRERAAPHDWIVLVRAMAAAARGSGGGLSAAHLRRLEALITRWPAERPLPAPRLDAEALVGLGVARGPRLGEILRALVDAEVEGRIVDESSAAEFVRRELESR